MRECKNCGHFVRKIKGRLLHRNEHEKYSGVSSGGPTFNKYCMSFKGLNACMCRSPELLAGEREAVRNESIDVECRIVLPLLN